jgi:hypothetical protein
MRRRAQIAKFHTAAINASDLVPRTPLSAQFYWQNFQGLEAKPLKPEKDISKMSSKRLKFRYGESDGTDKAAEDELRRRGLTDRQLSGVIWGYKQGEFTPKGGPYADPGKNRTEKQAAPDEATKPKAATDKVPVMYHGRFRGLPLSEVPEGYLKWDYGSFTKGRKRIEKELRARGYHERDLERCRKQHPVLGKFPKKQFPKD